jgi:hypothetical protein
MKVKVLRLERNHFGLPYYREVASVDYSEDHKWTEIERRIIDRFIIEQDNIGLEWDCLLDYARLNRVFIDWGKVSTYFHVSGNKCTLDKMLQISRDIFNKFTILDPFKLMVISAGCTKMPDHLRKKVRQIIHDVITKVLESYGRIGNKNRSKIGNKVRTKEQEQEQE